MKMTCDQFETLMHFYLDNELSTNIKLAFESHMQTCPKCKEKYNAFKNIIFDLRDSYQKFSKYESPIQMKKTTQQQNLNNYISAYVDNELDVKENVKIKKMIITKPDIREKIEKIYNLKLLLKGSFDKSQPKEDYSKNLLKKIYSNKQQSNNKDLLLALISFVILSVIWIVMLVASISV